MIQNRHLFPSSSSSFFIIVFLCSLARFTSCSSLNPKFEACQPATCGNQTITYPFYIEGRQQPFCGYPGFGLSCSDNAFPILNISHTRYIIHEISYITHSIRVSEAALSTSNSTSSASSCAIPRTHNITIEGTRFSYAPNQRNLFLLFGCNLGLLPDNLLNYRIGCSADNETNPVLAMTEGKGGDLRSATEKCNNTVVRTKISENQTRGEINMDVVRRGFVLNWLVANCSLCSKTRGKCGFDFSKNVYSFRCYCPDRDHAVRCDTVPAAEDRSRVLKLGLGIGLGIGLPVILMTVWLIGRWCYRRKHGSDDDYQFEPRNSFSADYSNSDPENGNIYLGVPLFSCKQLQEATNNFDQARVLGDGGFGIVYYGKLSDGREVAVKRLYEHNYRRVEQFRNEVKILARLRHKNLVSLYGCTSRRSQDLVLVYEYISNGTVASHLEGDLSNCTSLSWPIRIKIAIETASALVYLHASDIIHRDVKTSNILLDSNFNVKVADFGLSRLFPNDVSHVSTAPQGTPGYVDPEYYQCYQLTSKSDVYSFGVVLIELISSKPAVDISRSKDEVNLSSLAMKKIQESAFVELVDPSLGFEDDSEVKRMVVSVGELAFQCLQRDKDLRPSMEEVLEALKRIQSGKGEVENLEDGGNVNPLAPPPPSPPSVSPEKEEVGLLKKVNPPPSSPNTVTEKWTSESTTPNASA
ncbi:LEAF RUST 10 DISEASE-RESISTANCE LOCUS RECEPTOR-LIKE PROTEIN KINASE-like 1.2 isoform X1 [Neltuma alba]|uniref:LEAF RUST 10 DISEASE-RESISTANCE LOCUS RECEPTOR-LIKE PROTEIN KINASE-like 1.2 isoform X1 n=1 Tax=Neltuma alba TaxID=207710 RepID=UPI0010A451D2|nr:LEAF RUST 10 DISEASE-RESISTANCE LOCUS RECEPTOR-LIKE PROTEIN KINASE-like 1.2 isoform X1 [Prosopis alba]